MDILEMRICLSATNPLTPPAVVMPMDEVLFPTIDLDQTLEEKQYIETKFLESIKSGMHQAEEAHKLDLEIILQESKEANMSWWERSLRNFDEALEIMIESKTPILIP